MQLGRSGRRLLPRLSMLALLPAVGAGQCGWSAAGQTGCEPLAPPARLPEILRESSGVAWSRTHEGVLWSHNDGGDDPNLYAVDLEGNPLATLTLEGIRNRDWEDLATASCAAGTCLYIADTGDNAEVRPRVDLYRVVEPEPLARQALTAVPDRFPILLPDGPRDMEALFVLPGDEVYFVSKGRNHPATVYRYPPPLRAGEEVTLEEVQILTGQALPIPAQVTGADASSDGRVVAVRTYQALTFYRVEAGRLLPMEGGRVELRTLEEPQGEAVGFGPDGHVVLTTEAGNFGGVAAIRVLRCGGVG